MLAPRCHHRIESGEIVDRRTFISHAGMALALGYPLTASSFPLSVFEAELSDRDKQSGRRLPGKHKHCNPVIKMIGVGGFGCKAVNEMPDKSITGMDYICVDNDRGVLKCNQAENSLNLNGLAGTRHCVNLGARAMPQISRNAATEARGRLAAMLQGADVLFIAVGMGGGTGSGAAPVIAEIARDMGVLTVAFVTTPFAFEGYRNELAEAGIESLKPHADSLMILPNDRLLGKLGVGASLMDAFMTSTEFFNLAISEVADAIKSPGIVSVYFDDLYTMMRDSGIAMSASAWANGTDRAHVAAAKAAESLLSNDACLASARGVLVNVATNGSLTLSEVLQAVRVIRSRVGRDATVIYGSAHHNYGDNRLVVRILATGLPDAAASIDTRQLA